MKTKLIFMGTPAFSAPILKALVEAGYQVQAVVTQPDRPVGRKKILTPTPVKEEALKHGIEVLQPEKLNGSKEMERMIELKPDLIVTAAFGQFLPQAVLDIPEYGCINVHASLLPKYRGGAPVHYAIMKGEKETGVSIMYMEKKMDAGDVISQRSIPINSTDDVGTMFDKLSTLGRDLLIETIPHILSGDIHPVKQNEAEVTFSPNISREQEVIDWQMSASEIDCMVRGMRPWPGAYTLYQGARMKIWQVLPLEQKTTSEPGTVVAITEQQILIAAGDGTVLALEEIQPAGKSKMLVADYLRGIGKDMQIGDKVGTE